MSASAVGGLHPADQNWLPVIAHDDCVGCNRCVLVCGQHCLELVWDFATLVRADDCGGCGLCAKACTHGVIRMARVPLGRPAA